MVCASPSTYASVFHRNSHGLVSQARSFRFVCSCTFATRMREDFVRPSSSAWSGRRFVPVFFSGPCHGSRAVHNGLVTDDWTHVLVLSLFSSTLFLFHHVFETCDGGFLHPLFHRRVRTPASPPPGIRTPFFPPPCIPPLPTGRSVRGESRSPDVGRLGPHRPGRSRVRTGVRSDYRWFRSQQTFL